MYDLNKLVELRKAIFGAIALSNRKHHPVELAMALQEDTGKVRHVMNLLVLEGKLVKEFDEYYCNHAWLITLDRSNQQCVNCGKIESLEEAETTEPIIEAVEGSGEEQSKEPTVGEYISYQAIANTDNLGDTELLAKIETAVRQRVKGAFEIGGLLKIVRDRELYKTAGYKSFKDYCQREFGFNRDYCYKLIAAFGVYQNLESVDHGIQIDKTNLKSVDHGIQIDKTNLKSVDHGIQIDKTNLESVDHGIQIDKTNLESADHGIQIDKTNLKSVDHGIQIDKTNLKSVDHGIQIDKTNLESADHGIQILPTSERQVRPLAKFPKKEQIEIWQEAIAQTGGKPTGKAIADIIERRSKSETSEAEDVDWEREMHPDLEAGDIELESPRVTITKDLENRNVYQLPVSEAVFQKIKKYCERLKFISFNAAIHNLLAGEV